MYDTWKEKLYFISMILVGTLMVAMAEMGILLTCMLASGQYELIRLPF